jgi:hypothetical protein
VPTAAAATPPAVPPARPSAKVPPARAREATPSLLAQLGWTAGTPTYRGTPAPVGPPPAATRAKAFEGGETGAEDEMFSGFSPALPTR